jgi:protein-S-isoprenylcysteine O-methyltransferase Ste14
MGILHGFVGPYCDRRGLWIFQSPVVRWIGIVVFAAGVVLRVAAMRTLGNRFSVWVALQNSHVLVTGGLYRYLRHPSYTGALLALVGSGMVFRSELAVVIALTMVLPLMPRMDAEEKMLIEEFGSQYIEYQDRTWRIIPWVY